jgi:short-subunit dehydrogenase
MMTPPARKTALITGASSGIGESFARHLAEDGYQLILVARRGERLNVLAAELEGRFNTASQVITADLSAEEGIQLVVEHIKQLDPLNLLVNNAGFGMSGYFSRIEIEKHQDMNRVHIEAAVRLSHAALPGMIDQQQGGIINVSSVAAFLPWGNVTYNATKAYLVAFSEALYAESRSKNIRVQALCPGFTRSEFHDSPELVRIRKSPLLKIFWLSSDFVVSESLRCLARGKVICIPGLQYRFAVALGRSPITSPLLRAAVLRIRQRSPA